MKAVSEGREFGRGEDAITYITTQVIGCFMCSGHVEEIFSDDATLNRKMRAVLRKHMSEGQDVEREVRARMKNIEEGSREWDVEFSRLRDEIAKRTERCRLYQLSSLSAAREYGSATATQLALYAVAQVE